MKDENGSANDTGDTLDIVRRLIDEADAAPAPEAVATPAKTPVEKAPAATKTAKKAPKAIPVAEAPQPAPVVEQPMTRPITRSMSPSEQHGFDELLSPEECNECVDAPDSWSKRAFDAAVVAAKEFFLRPEAPREMALALLAISTILWTGYVAAMAVLVVVSFVITWFTLGPDESAERIVAWHARLAERDPEKAETIRLRAAKVSRFVTKIVERLPDHWTTGLVVPDFEPSQDLPEKMKDDPFARLASEARS